MLDLLYESQILDQGFNKVVGIDEAGRGAWAGPVAVGYYVVDAELIENSEHKRNNVDDSKKLSVEFRELLYPKLISNGGVVTKSVAEIDELGIVGAVEDAIADIIEKFDASTYFLIDGYFKRKYLAHYQLHKKGDSKFYSIAAASVLAKVKRDRIMQELGAEFPEYGLEKHKGYGTKFHRQRLDAVGVSSVHRTSFKPMKQMLVSSSIE